MTQRNRMTVNHGVYQHSTMHVQEWYSG